MIHRAQPLLRVSREAFEKPNAVAARREIEEQPAGGSSERIRHKSTGFDRFDLPSSTSIL
jgi:hypothetical protein